MEDTSAATKIRIPKRRPAASVGTPTPTLSTDGVLGKLRNKRIRELRRLSYTEDQVDIPEDAKPEEVLPELLRNALGYMRWARDMVGNLKPEEFWLIDPRTNERLPGAEFELEMRTLAIAKSLCEMMIRFEIDQRGVVVEEAKVDILTAALKAAVQEAGLDDETARKVGQALRGQLQLIEGGAA